MDKTDTLTEEQKKSLIEQGLMSPDGRLLSSGELIRAYYKDHPDENRTIKAGPISEAEFIAKLKLKR